MTMRNVSLTAVAALTVALAGGALAQDNSTAAGVTAPAGSSYQGEPSSTEATPAAEAPAAEAPAEEAPAETPAEAPAEAEPAPAAEAPAEAPAEATEAPAAEAAPEAPAEEPAAEPAAEAPATEAPATEAPAEAEPAAEPAAEAPAAEAPAAEEPAAEAPATETPVAEEPAAEAPAAAEEAPAADEPAAAVHIEDVSFSFEGPFGKYDQFQLQRGLQVYTEVCSACHGLTYVPLRTLGDAGGPGLPEDQVRAYAANLSIIDQETGEERPRTPTDHFPTVHGEGMGPDLSLMAKARAAFHGPYGTGMSQLFNGTGGPEYIHGLLVGYNGETKDEAGSTFYHNAAFAGNWIQMPQPLMDDQITYEDGTEASVDQMSKDVAAFLMWTAEPKLGDRKQVGLVSVLFMILLTVLLYLTNKRLWWSVKHRNDEKR